MGPLGAPVRWGKFGPGPAGPAQTWSGLALGGPLGPWGARGPNLGLQKESAFARGGFRSPFNKAENNTNTKKQQNEKNIICARPHKKT